MKPFARNEKSIHSDSKGDARYFDANPVGNSDIRTISKEGKKSQYKTLKTIKFVKTPKITSLKDECVDDRRSKNNKKTKEKKMRGTCERLSACKSNDGDEKEKGGEKKEEGMRKFEKEERK